MGSLCLTLLYTVMYIANATHVKILIEEFSTTLNFSIMYVCIYLLSCTREGLYHPSLKRGSYNKQNQQFYYNYLILTVSLLCTRVDDCSPQSRSNFLQSTVITVLYKRLFSSSKSPQQVSFYIIHSVSSADKSDNISNRNVWV